MAQAHAYLRFLGSRYDGLWFRNAQGDRRSMEVKDAMRESCIGDLIRTCHELIAGYYASQPGLATSVLEALCRFVNWADISLLTKKECALFSKQRVDLTQNLVLCKIPTSAPARPAFIGHFTRTSGWRMSMCFWTSRPTCLAERGKAHRGDRILVRAGDRSRKVGRLEKNKRNVLRM